MPPRNIMENVYANESYETSAAATDVGTDVVVPPPGICKPVGIRKIPNRSSSTHSVRILSPTPPSPTATLPLAEVTVSTISIPPMMMMVEPDQQDDNQQHERTELPPVSLKLQGNSTNSTTASSGTKKAKVDFVRFDSTEIHYTDHDEVRTKISDEIKR